MKTKIILISIILIISALLSGCMELGGHYRHSQGFDSHEKFVDFLNVYNDTGRSFVSFDLDSYDAINKCEYAYYAFYNHRDLIIDDTFYDSKAGECTIYYYFSSNATEEMDDLNDSDFEIECIYFRSDISFDRKEQLELKDDGNNHFLKNDGKSSYSRSIISSNRYCYSLFVSNDRYMDIRISTQKNMTHEELNSLFSILLDSIVIVR